MEMSVAGRYAYTLSPFILLKFKRFIKNTNKYRIDFKEFK